MTVDENIRDAVESIRANSLRSLLTMLGIIVGVGSLIAMLSVGAGAQSRVAAQIGSLGANVLMILPGAERDAAGGGSDHARPVKLTRADAEAIAAAIPEVNAVAPSLRGQARVVQGNRNWATQVNGTTSDYFFIRDWPLVAGRGFSRREEDGAGKVALIGATVAEQLFGDADPIGREVRVLNTPMRIIGMLAAKGQSGSGRDQDDIVFVPYTTAKLRLGASGRGVIADAVSYILAKAASGDHVAGARAGIEGLLRQRHDVPIGAAAGFRVTDPAAAMAAQRGSTRTIGWLLAAIASISLVVGGISIMNIMLVSVTERTREIGLRLALGARRRDISRLFLIEALLICLVGGVLGFAAGITASWLVTRLAGWPILMAPETFLAALAFAVLVGLIFGYYPARKAARLLPATALRND
jgi:putative ABC transport system permease protein